MTTVAVTGSTGRLGGRVATAAFGDDDVIRGPAGDGRVAAVAQDDIADAAVAVLTAPDAHAGVTYHLTGPQALTLREVADLLTTATGRDVTYHPETVAEAYASRRRATTFEELLRAAHRA